MDENKIKQNGEETSNAPETKKVKNKMLLKKGTYSIAVTALVIAAAIVVNVLFSVLSERVNLEFDMTSEKVNSVNEKNIKYLKSIDKDVDITVCAAEDDYSSMMNYYAQSYGVSAADVGYFDQTVNLINKYYKYNNKLNIKFIDPQSSEFSAIATKHSALKISYGDIIVTAKKDDSDEERVKKIGFSDIYESSDTSGSGYYYTITANKLETALTGAISYVVSGQQKKAALITGHSSSDNTSAYVELLKSNNYEIETISDPVVNEIPSDCNVVVIASANLDFMESELTVISEFLENGGKLSKGLVFFGDASCPALPNLYDFLKSWGINCGEGVLFETEDNRRNATQDPTTLFLYPDESAGIDNIGVSIAGYNIPITISEPSNTAIDVTTIMTTTETTAKAPVGAASDWNDPNAEKGKFVSVAKAEKTAYDSSQNNKKIKSYVVAFSSIQYIQSDWAQYSRLYNQDTVLACTELASGITEPGVTFTSKVITDTSFSDKVTESGKRTIRVLFETLLPLAVLAVGITVYIRRRNAE